MYRFTPFDEPHVCPALQKHQTQQPIPLQKSQEKTSLHPEGTHQRRASDALHIIQPCITYRHMLHVHCIS